MSLRYAREHFRVPIAFEDPPGSSHLIEDRQACRIAVVGRSAHAVVVEPVQRNGLCRAESVGVRKLDIEGDRLVLPLDFGLDDRTFAGERGVEVRAPRRESGGGGGAGLPPRPRWV